MQRAEDPIAQLNGMEEPVIVGLAPANEEEGFADEDPKVRKFVCVSSNGFETNPTPAVNIFSTLSNASF